MHNNTLHHIPVLAHTIADYASIYKPKTIIDGTLGLGGHTELLINTLPDCQFIGIDADIKHLDYAKKRLDIHKNISYYNTNFSNIQHIIHTINPHKPLLILLDLGICSAHIDVDNRGFSFKYDAKLDMRYDNNLPSAYEYLINTDKIELSRVLCEYGEMKNYNKYAALIKDKLPSTTYELRDIIEHHTHPKERKDAVMKVFQAIRIAVNKELDVLKKVLTDMPTMLSKGDIMMIISYHSLEDRLVKNAFKEYSTATTEATEYDNNSIIEAAKSVLITRHPIVPSTDEIALNPRSRSAKLRILQWL